MSRKQHKRAAVEPAIQISAVSDHASVLEAEIQRLVRDIQDLLEAQADLEEDMSYLHRQGWEPRQMPPVLAELHHQIRKHKNIKIP